MSRSPDWIVKYLDKSTEERGKIGAGWNNDDGSISIVLNPLVVIHATKDFEIRLFNATTSSK